MFTWLVHRRNAMGGRVFLKNKITDKLISVVVNEFAKSLKLLFRRLLKNINNFCIWVLGPRPMTLENLHFAKQIKKTLDKMKRPLFLLNIFKILLYTCL